MTDPKQPDQPIESKPSESKSGEAKARTRRTGGRLPKGTPIAAEPVPPEVIPAAPVGLPTNLVSDLLESEIFAVAPQPIQMAATPVGRAEQQQAVASEPAAEIFDELEPMYPDSGPFLTRFLPRTTASYLGLRAPYAELHTFLKYLHDRQWNGYLYAALGEQHACVLLFEGRTVAAATNSAGNNVGGQTGEQALAELLRLYEQGAELSGHALSSRLAHVLSGVGSRAWKFDLTDDFTGVHAGAGGAIFYASGEVIATMNVSLPQEGAFPAPLRPQTLILPRSLAGWAHHPYSPTLRGRDAVNAITEVHLAFRTKYGSGGLSLLRALIQNQTPAEYAMREDLTLHDLETLIKEFTAAGYLRA